MDTSLLYRTLQCWNSPFVIEAGTYGHLSARAKWIDGRCIVIPREVEDATIHELPEKLCVVDLDGGWLTVIVPGPAVIPARAKISVRVRADIATPTWLAELSDSEARLAKNLADEGML
jgi:hypothetical protein